MGSSSNRYAPACPNKKQNHLQNSLLRRTQFWVRNTFSKPASLKKASLVLLDACRQDCTKRAMDRLWRRPAMTRISYLCQDVLLRWMASTPNAANPQQPTTHQRSASQRYHLRRTLSQYGTNPVARRRSERHPSDSRQESGGRRAKCKAGSCPRM